MSQSEDSQVGRPADRLAYDVVDGLLDSFDGSGSDLTKSQRTRRKILDAAAEVFSEVGYANARLVDIAEKAEMRAGSLYYHFDSRDELVIEIQRLGTTVTADRVRAAVEALPPEAPALTRIEIAARSHVLTLLAFGNYAAADARIAGEIPDEISRANRKVQREYSDYWDQLLRDAKAAGDLAPGLDIFATRMLVFGAMNWTPKWFTNDGRLSAEEMADQTVMLLLEGITNGPARGLRSP